MTGIMRRCREKKMIKNDRICLHPRPGRSCLSYFQLQFSSLSKFYRWFLSIDNSLVIAEVYFNPKENLKKGGERRREIFEGEMPRKSRKIGKGILRDGNLKRGRRRLLVGILEFYSIRDPITSSRERVPKRGSCRRNYEFLPFHLLNILMECCATNNHNRGEGKKVENLWFSSDG